MFAQFFKATDFYDKYIQLYTMRQAIANLEMEDNITDMLSPSRTQEMYNSVIAFENILAKQPEKISPYDLIDIAADINGDIYSKGFRKTQVEVKRASNFYPPSAREVPQIIYSIFNAYHNIWNELPVYEKEARMHIELVRAQPFEDGNKRSTRILTNYNLFMQNKAPVIISAEEIDKYFSFIDNYDIEGMASFLKAKSEEEFDILLDLYNHSFANVVGDFNNVKAFDIKSLVRNKKQ